MPGVLM